MWWSKLFLSKICRILIFFEKKKRLVDKFQLLDKLVIGEKENVLLMGEDILN